MHGAALWRYPVNWLAGEPLHAAELTGGGGAGTATFTSAAAPARSPAAGTAATAGRPSQARAGTAPRRSGSSRSGAGPAATLRRYDGPERFDDTNLVVATDGAVRRFGHDVRRLPSNLLLSGVDPAEEATWPGAAHAIGDALVGIPLQRQRCIVTSIDSDTGTQDVDVFRHVRKEFDNRLALNSWVITPGMPVGSGFGRYPSHAARDLAGPTPGGAPSARRLSDSPILRLSVGR